MEEEEEVVVRESVANYSAVGNHRSCATNDESAVVRCDQTPFNRFSSFLCLLFYFSFLVQLRVQ